LVATPAQLYKIVNTATEKTSIVGADKHLIADSADSGINKYVSHTNLLTQLNTDGV
jgi:hypothetical protein